MAGNSLPVVRHRFNAAIALAGVLDLHTAAALNLSDHAVSTLLGGSPAEVPDRYIAASPSALIPDTCPRLLLHGAADDIVPVSFSETFQAAACDTIKSTVSSRILPDTNHFDLIDPSSPAWPTVEAAILETMLTSSATTTYPSPAHRERDQG